MSNRLSSYEELYGVGLLDDLHNYFPALLYDSEEFRTVQDVLQYISLQTRRRFDLYSFGLDSYERSSGVASSGAESNVPTNHQFYQSHMRVATAANLVRPPPPPVVVATTASVLPPPPPPPPTQSSTSAQTRTTSPDQPRSRLPAPTRYVFQDTDGNDLGDMNMSSNVLTALLAGLEPRFVRRTGGRMDDLTAIASLLLGANTNLNMMGGLGAQLEPVVVRPTNAQIERATELNTPTSEQDCAVCQDTITTSQQCRKILHCGHNFHVDCIDPWFRQNVACPVCRFDIREHPQENHQSPAPARQQNIPEEEDYH
jgi:hypothetical protein